LYFSGDDVTPGEEVVRWAERFCRIPEGRDVGKPVVLRPWQRDIIKAIYDNPHGTRRAIVSVGRKNAKTTLAAFLLLAHLCGPRSKPNSQLYSAAQARDQAAILFELAAKIVRMSPDLAAVVTPRDTRKELFCRELGTLYRALSAEASTAYGLSPAFVVHDELGQVKGPRSELYEALETASAAQEHPLSLVISTQAPTDSDLLSILIDDGKKAADPRVVLSLYAADPDLDPFDVETIRQANPAFGDFQNADEVLAMAEDARRMPSREAEFRNLILNQRVERFNPFVSKSIWQSCGADPLPFDRSTPVYGGLDLSAVRDLTALVLVGWMDGKWQVHPTFWLPEDGLVEKARRDRVPYDLWRDQRYLRTAPGRSVDYEYVAEHLRSVFDRLNIVKIGFDRKFVEFLKPWLNRAGFSEADLETRFHSFGQGWVSMTPALRFLETEIANGRLAHGNHPVLAMCARNAVVKGDEKARTLAKRSDEARIDGMVALTMAMGVAPTDPAPAFDVMAMIG
jgi:phage terminase large subunit-like protein